MSLDETGGWGDMMAGDTKNAQDGPKRIQKVLGEIFEFFMAHGQVKNLTLADKTIQMTANKLGGICQECQMQLRGGGEVEEVAAPPPTKGNEKRRLFLLRLVTSKLSHLFDPVHNPNPMDRAYALGLDLYFRRIFSQNVYIRLNGEAKQILGATGSDDIQVFNTVNTNPFFNAFVQNVLIRLALTFKKYEGAKGLFMQDVNSALPNDYPDMTNEQFRVLMSALLFDVFMKGKSEMDGKLLEFRFGPGTADTLNAISDKFGTDR